MAAAEMPPGVGERTPENSDPRAAGVRAELDRILVSAQFRGTKRSQEFLRFVVERKLQGQTDTLKERWIGVEIFGRSPDYDTGEDSIVRVKANEVRKRLAQYHMGAGPAPMVEIELPPGSYVPEFKWLVDPDPPKPAEEPAPAAAPAPEVVELPARRQRPGWLIPAAAGAVVALAAIAWFGFSRPAGAAGLFWEPFVKHSEPALICIAHPSVHHLTGATREAFARGEVPANVPGTDIVVDPDHYVGVGDALAAARLSSFFARAGKNSRVRVGNDISFADLRTSPAVLIGAFTNQWTMQAQADLRFVFESDGGRWYIRDRRDPGRRWAGAANLDYALVSRVVNPNTGQPVVTAAGLSHFGTESAGEFVTSPEHLASAMKSVPRGWERRNLQMVIRTDVVGGRPGPPQVVETQVW